MSRPDNKTGKNTGILTIAYGARKYLRMGRALALSIRHHAEASRLAVVTDTPEYFEDLYDHIVPVDLSYGSGVTQKLYLDRYSPFEETLFVDSDCLLYGAPDPLWSFFTVEEGLGVRSWGPLTPGDHCQGVEDLGRYLDYFDIEHVHNIKGGFYYFDSSSTTRDIFGRARDIYGIRDKIGLTAFKNAAVADEAVIATALELSEVEPIRLRSPDAAPANTFLGRTEPIAIDVLEGRSQFVKNGVEVEPTAIHYPIGTQIDYHYLRDISRLELRDGPLTETRANVRGKVQEMYYLGRRKWENVQSRVRERGLIGVLPGRVLQRFGVTS